MTKVSSRGKKTLLLGIAGGYLLYEKIRTKPTGKKIKTNVEVLVDQLAAVAERNRERSGFSQPASREVKIEGLQQKIKDKKSIIAKLQSLKNRFFLEFNQHQELADRKKELETLELELAALLNDEGVI